MSTRSAPSMSLVENTVNASSAGVGHYKGVMLCNRPFAGTQANHKLAGTAANPDRTNFSCGVVSETIGINVPIAMKEKQIRRPKKDSVLVKHKRWLAELQRTKDQLEETYLGELQAKEEAQAKFAEHEKKMREISRSMLIQTDAKSSTNLLADAKDSKQASSESKHDYKQSNEPAPRKAQSAAQLGRPAWAMTEDKAEMALDQRMEAEEDDLLDFAKSLSYDKYIGDLEVRIMMERLRKRIGDLEKDVAMEDQREADAETRMARREMLELMGNAEAAMLQEGDAKVSADSQALQTAKALLEDDENMQNVHSTKSVVAMLKAAKDKISVVQTSVQRSAGTMVPIESTVSNEPKVVIHDPAEGSRLEGKNAVSNLPYMHRNPAI